MTHPIPPVQKHGDLHEVFPDVFFVMGSMRMAPLTRVSRNMIVLRQGEELVIVNSVRLDDDGLAALDALGRVTHVVRIAGFHGSDDRFYKERYGATVWALPGQTYFKGLNPKTGAIYFEPDKRISADEHPVQGGSFYVFDTKPAEAVLRIEAGGGTLISGDALHNWDKVDEYFSLVAGLGMRVAGFIKPHNLGPGWRDSCHPDREQVRGMLDLEFDNVLPGHGAPVLGDAREKYRATIEAYADKAG